MGAIFPIISLSNLKLGLLDPKDFGPTLFYYFCFIDFQTDRFSMLNYFFFLACAMYSHNVKRDFDILSIFLMSLQGVERSWVSTDSFSLFIVKYHELLGKMCGFLLIYLICNYVYLLLDWLPTKSRYISLPSYLTHAVMG